MHKVYLFHHAMGRTQGVLALADRLRRLGHDIDVPDLFGGMAFANLDEGVAHAEEVGFETIAERGEAAVTHDRFAVVGLSLGVMPAQRLAQTDPRVSGAVLISSVVPLGFFGEEWPPSVPVEMHLVRDDSWAEEDIPAAKELADVSGGALHLHPGGGHLVLEAGHPDHDVELADAIVGHVDDFLRRLPA